MEAVEVEGALRKQHTKIVICEPVIELTLTPVQQRRSVTDLQVYVI